MFFCVHRQAWFADLILIENSKYKNNNKKLEKLCLKFVKSPENNVSHSKRRTKRKFNVNVFNRKFYWPEQGQWIRLTVSASGLRNINKMGLDAALKKAAEDGHLTEIQVINK